MCSYVLFFNSHMEPLLLKTITCCLNKSVSSIYFLEFIVDDYNFTFPLLTLSAKISALYAFTILPVFDPCENGIASFD